VCSSETTGRITSGGGFSTNYPKQDWQAAAVAKYFTTAAAAGKSPIPGYNTNGRAYPDISVMGLNYLVMYGGGWVGMAGTSAACPVMAGFISNINAARMAIGKGSVGWVNPALYAHSSSFVNDIVTGNNKCSATAPCCPHGYEAVSGWDPASGLGSVNYAKMQAKFLTLGSVNAGSESPTVKPSGAPTVTPTSAPTRQPTIAPTVYLPTATPSTTKTPTRKPTYKYRPTRRPNRRAD
jgi:PT repeat